MDVIEAAIVGNFFLKYAIFILKNYLVGSLTALVKYFGYNKIHKLLCVKMARDQSCQMHP